MGWGGESSGPRIEKRIHTALIFTVVSFLWTCEHVTQVQALQQLPLRFLSLLAHDGLHGHFPKVLVRGLQLPPLLAHVLKNNLLNVADVRENGIEVCSFARSHLELCEGRDVVAIFGPGAPGQVQSHALATPCVTFALAFEAANHRGHAPPLSFDFLALVCRLDHHLQLHFRIQLPSRFSFKFLGVLSPPAPMLPKLRSAYPLGVYLFFDNLLWKEVFQADGTILVMVKQFENFD
mmetsp:Transcript_57568/g.108491  ORF Transcript_57568/g.108491 Transcript_57568/m.108491 type:complete len:235 (+) Transcript_57568:2-706(+)